MYLSSEPSVTEYINSFYRPLDDFLGSLREDGEKRNVPIILKETETYLNTLLTILKPKKILEIGTAIGYSAIYFAKKCPDAEIYSIEKFAEVSNEAKRNVEEAGLSKRIHLLTGDGEESVLELEKEGIIDFDFVFIDAAKSQYQRFFESVTRVSKENAVILADNIWQHGFTFIKDENPPRKHRTNIRKMRSFVESMENSKEFTTSLINVGDGLLLATK